MPFEPASTLNQPDHQPAKRTAFSLYAVLRLILGCLLGAAVGYGFVAFARLLGVSPKSMSWADGLAIWMGIVFIAFGIALAWLAFNRRQLARALEGSTNAGPNSPQVLPATNREVRSALLQSAVLILAGVMLLAPILAVGPLHAHPEIALFIYAGIFLLFLIQTALNIELWRSSDEFLRQTLLIVSAATFAIGQALLFLYAAAERLNLAPAINSWQVVTPLLTIYLVTSFAVGLMQRR